MSVFGSVPMRVKESHVAIPGSRINSNSRRKAMSEHDPLHEDTETVSELFTFGFVEIRQGSVFEWGVFYPLRG